MKQEHDYSGANKALALLVSAIIAGNPFDDEHQQAYETIRAALTAAKWRPIESAPNPSGKIILYGKTKHAGFPVVCQGHFYSPMNRWEYHDTIGGIPHQPTHWMPLPKPPQDGGDDVSV